MTISSYELFEKSSAVSRLLAVQSHCFLCVTQKIPFLLHVKEGSAFRINMG
ncbi:hypothetical protein CAter282_3524 [Collimonas arenae]|uniref:Uncharacterized protein n=1 Tax=Collimonas arenae TaxID=279058 RepID=A0A127PVA9_9BURK|nr:hypothetical protein CAter10_3858 [Collimonas arenae]AMP11210.1 hypothetical protein CAter282_3524 [Collimonas arenae]